MTIYYLLLFTYFSRPVSHPDKRKTNNNGTPDKMLLMILQTWTKWCLLRLSADYILSTHMRALQDFVFLFQQLNPLNNLKD